MATLIIIAILAAGLYLFVGIISINSRVEPYAADIKTLAFWTFVIALAGAVFHKIL